MLGISPSCRTRVGRRDTATTSGVVTHTYSYPSPTTNPINALREDSDAISALFSSTKSLARSYDTATGVKGRPTGFTFDSHHAVGYGYDSVRRLNNVTGPGLPGSDSDGTPTTGSGAIYKFPGGYWGGYWGHWGLLGTFIF